jgi:hypothetical protein
MALKSKTSAGGGGKRTTIYQAARKAGREARRAATDVAGSAEAQRAINRARLAVRVFGKAATAAAALVSAAWRASEGHARAFGHSRELRALQTSARRAAETALANARTVGAAAGKRGVASWNRAVTSGKRAVSRAERSIRQASRKYRATARKK